MSEDVLSADMSTPPRPAVTPQAVVGVSICLMGIALTLDNLGIYQLRSFAELWPIVPISIGVLTLMYGETRQDWVKGTLWLALGIFFIFRHPFIRDIWPIMLIALGGYLVWRSRTGPPPARKWQAEVHLETDDPHRPFSPPPASAADAASAPFTPPPIPEEYVRSRRKRSRSPWDCSSDWRSSPPPPPPPGRPPFGAENAGRGDEQAFGAFRRTHTANGRGQRPTLFAMMSGVRRQVTGGFAGGEATAIMGGVELDLRYSAMDGDEVIIDTFALWGGIEIWVPAHWEIVSQGLPLMGAFEDKTHIVTHAGAPQPRLIVRGVAIMGGVEIKN
jgi:hypothetical protein